MNVRIGNHMKMQMPHALRETARRFYTEVLGCRPLAEKPYPNLDLYQFGDGLVIGLFFCDADEALEEREQLKAVWLELQTEDPEALRRKLLAFGVREVKFADPTRFYFQAPGGQVYRLAPLGGGL